MLNFFSQFTTANIVVILAAIISSYTVWRNARRTERLTREMGERNLQSLEQRRYQDAIITQRMEWVEKLRESFIEFQDLADSTQAEIFFKYNNGDPVELYSFSVKSALEMQKIINRVVLLSNQNENWFEKLYTEMIVLKELYVSKNVLKGFTDEDLDKYESTTNKLRFLQQAILKTEWNRVQDETESGKKMNQESVEKLFHDIAAKLDPELYIELFENEAS